MSYFEVKAGFLVWMSGAAKGRTGPWLKPGGGVLVIVWSYPPESRG